MSWHGFAPYVPVAERRRRAMRKMDALRKRGHDIRPVHIEGRKIAKTFWGQAWCEHLESFSDFENRLPRGRTYVRNGSVCHLAVAKGKIEAKVSGSEIYNLRIRVKTLPGKKWKAVKRRCAGQIGSLLELLTGKLSEHVMQVVTDRRNGLFPLPGQIEFDCDCPDWATMCKHVAAVLYGVGARLDENPELLFVLRGVDQQELIDADAEAAVTAAATRGTAKRLAAGELSGVFGIEIELDGDAAPSNESTSKRTRKRRTRTKGKKASQNTTAPKADAATKKPGRKAAKGFRFSARSVKAHRTRLGLSAADYAKLVGVSPVTVYNWEKGKSRPCQEKRAALAAVRGIGKRAALAQLESLAAEETASAKRRTRKAGRKAR